MGGDVMTATAADAAAPTADGERSAQATVAPAPVEAPAADDVLRDQHPGGRRRRGRHRRDRRQLRVRRQQDGVRIVDVADAEVVGQPELPNGSHQLLLDGTGCSSSRRAGPGGRHGRVAVRRDRPGERRRCCAAPTSKARCSPSRAVDGTRPTRDLDVVRHPAAVRASRPVRPRRGTCARAQQADHRRVDGRGLDAPLVRRGGRRIVRRDAADRSTARRSPPRRVRRARRDVDRIDRPARRGHAGRVGRHRVERRNRVRLDDQHLPGDRRGTGIQPAGRRRGDRRLDRRGRDDGPRRR